MIQYSSLRTHCEIVLGCVPHDLINDKSTLVQVMSWCHQVTGHYIIASLCHSVLTHVMLNLFRTHTTHTHTHIYIYIYILKTETAQIIEIIPLGKKSTRKCSHYRNCLWPGDTMSQDIGRPEHFVFITRRVKGMPWVIGGTNLNIWILDVA